VESPGFTLGIMKWLVGGVVALVVVLGLVVVIHSATRQVFDSGPACVDANAVVKDGECVSP
jgi:hypothetical protein